VKPRYPRYLVAIQAWGVQLGVRSRWPSGASNPVTAVALVGALVSGNAPALTLVARAMVKLTTGLCMHRADGWSGSAALIPARSE